MNGGALDYAGMSSVAQTKLIVGAFYPGDALQLTYTSDTPKAGIVVTLIQTGLTLDTVITGSTGTSATLNGTVGILGAIGAEAGHADATAVLTPRNVTIVVRCTPAPTPTTMSVTSSVNPTVVGQSTTLTAAVAASQGTANGNVVFSIDGVAQAPVALSGGNATLALSNLSAGNHSVSASYAGNSNFTASNATLSGGQTVNAAVTTTSIATSPRPSNYGQSITLTSQVAAVAPGAGTPTGSVIFTIDGADQAPVTLSSGTSTLSTAALAAGTHSIAARYVGTSSFAASASGALSGGHLVNTATNTTSVTQSAASTVYGASTSFTATVASGGGTPTGSVVFTIDGAAQAPIALSGGQAAISTSALAVGAHTVSADYYGSANFATSTGTLSPTHTVTAASTTLSIAGPGAISFGQNASFTATVASAAGTPSGTVVFTIDGVAKPPVTLSAGQASFQSNGLSTGSHTVSASYAASGNFAAVSGTLSGGQTVNKAATTTTTTASSASTSYGQSVTFTASVASSAGTPTGSVTFTIDGVTQAPVTLSGGAAALTTSSLAAGAHTVSASYGGATDYATSSGTLPGGLPVTAATTTSAASASVNPAVFGQSVTLTATIASSDATPAGSVIFTIDGVAVTPAATLSGGVATLPVSNLAVGHHTVAIAYQGSANFVASNATLGGGLTVTKAATTTALAAIPSPSEFGENVDFTATVMAVAPGGGAPSGSVTFAIDGVTQAPAALSGGVATLSSAALTVGSHTVTAVYGGDTGFGQSSGTLNGGHSVAAAATTTSVLVSPEPSGFGVAVSVTVTIASDDTTPTGQVIVTVDGVDRAPVALRAGVATLDLSNLSAGPHTISARYQGTTSFLGSSAGTTNHVVAKATTTTAVSSGANPGGYGDAIVVTAAVTSTAGTPDGSVTFAADGNDFATVTLMAGSASAQLPVLTTGSHAVTARFSGSGNYNTSSGTLAGGQVIGAGTTTLNVSANPASPAYGDTVRISATLGAQAGTPSGLVTFSINGNAAPAVATASGVAQLDLAGLVPGHYAITASYAGSADHAPIQLPLPGGLTVSKASSTLAVSSSSAAPSFGDSVTFTAAVTSGGGVPTGQVIFSIDGVPQAPVTIDGSGNASLTVAGLVGGSHSVTASYAGDSKVVASSGSLGGGQSVGTTATTLSVLASPASGGFGDSIMLTATLSASSGTPAGSAVFSVDGIAYAPVAISGGEANLSLAGLTVGTHTVGVNYAGSANHGAASASLPGGLVIAPAAASLNISGPMSTVMVGDTVPFTATLSSSAGTPSGSVVFSVDGVAQSPSALVAGQASTVIVFSNAGQHAVSASYAGSAYYGPASSVFSGGVAVEAATTTTLVSSAAIAEFGEAVSVTAQVTSTAGMPVGSVAFSVDGVPYGTAVLSSGSAAMQFTGLSIGNHAITAVYAGSQNFASSNGAVMGGLAVNPAATTTSVTTDHNPIVEGQTVLVTASVGSTHGTATGSVAFYADGMLAGTASLSGGSASFSMTGLTAGSHAITAEFLGASTFDPSSGALAGTLTVDPAPTDIAVVANLPAGTIGVAYAGALAPVGGTAPYALSIDSGALPTGLSLDLVTGAITGTPTVAGTFNFDVTATGMSGLPDTGSYHIDIAAPVVITMPGGLGAGVFGAAYTDTVAASGGASPYTYAVISGSLPVGLALNAVTGALTGTPVQSGTAPFTIRATDANGAHGDASYSISVGNPTVTVGGLLADGHVGQPYSGAVTVSGGNAPYTYSVSTGTLPQGVSLDAATGALSGTPTLAGTFSFTVVAEDANGFSGSASYMLDMTVVPVVILPGGLPNGRAGQPYHHSVAASGAASPYAYAITAGSLPSGWTLDATTGVVSGTTATPGAYSFDVTAIDANGLPGTVSYAITVAAAATITTPPSIAAATAGNAYSDTVTASGGAAPYGYAIIGGALPSGITLDPSTGDISGTTLVPGSYNFVIEITDANGDQASRGFVLVVAAPQIILLTTTPAGAYNTAYSGSLAASGGVAPYGYAVTSGALPGGVVVDPGTGAISGTPTDDGTFSAIITATDANGFTGQQSIRLSVSAPVISVSAPTLSGMDGQAFAQTITASGGAAPYGFSLDSGALPTGVTLATGGLLSGTPTTVGNYTFTVLATDADGYAATANFTLAVASNVGTADLPPVISGAAGEPYVGSVAATGGTAPYTYAITGGSLPTGITLDPSTGAITGTTTQTGSFPVTITVTDATNHVNTETVTLTIDPPALQPNTTPPAQDAGMPYSVALTVTGGAGPYTYAWDSGTVPAGMTYDAATSTLSGTPTVAGTFRFKIRATDVHGFVTINEYVVTLAPPAITAPAALPDGGLGTPYSQTIVPTGGTGPYGFAVTAGSLPQGLTLNPTTGLISGTPTVTGPFSVEVTMTDTMGFTGTVQVDFDIITNVGTAVLPTTASVSDGGFGQSYSHSFAASGGTAPYTYAITSGSLPTGLTLNPTTGLLSGTPTVAGYFSFVVTVTDNTGLVNNEVYDIQVAAPVITLGGTMPTGEAGTPLSIFITANGGSAPYSFGIQGAPNGLIINAATGEISGTPTISGSFTVTVLVRDADGFVTTQTFQLNIDPAPVTLALPASLPSGWEGQAYIASAAPTNGTGPYSFSVSAGALPTGLSLNTGTGAITGTPTTANAYTFTIAATDALLNAGSRAYSVTVSPASPVQEVTTTTVTSSNTSPAVGASVVLTATVASAGVTTPTGAVTFIDTTTGNTLGSVNLNAGGIGTLSMPFATVATHNVSATYAGTATHVASAGTVAINPQPAHTTLALTGVSGTWPAGQTLVAVATVTRNAPAVGTPGTGTIRFLLDGVELQSLSSSSGSGTFTHVMTAGQHTLRAEYSAIGAADLASFDQQVITVEADTTTALAVPGGIAILGGSLSFSATLSPVAPATGTPTGSVTFFDGATVLGSATLSAGTANFATTALTVGSHDIKAVYAGDGAFRTSQSTILPQIVVATPLLPGETVAAMTPSNPSPQIGEPVLLQMLVLAGDATIPTGLVTFIDDSTGITLGTSSLDSTGHATLTYAFNDALAHTVRGVYAGDAGHDPSQASAKVRAVLAQTSIILSAPTAALFTGDTITLGAHIARLAPAQGMPATSFVEFLADGAVIGRVSTEGLADVTLTTGPLFDETAFSARLLASTTDAGSEANTLSRTATKRSVMLAASIASTDTGYAVTVAVEPATATGFSPSGQVTLRNSLGLPDQVATISGGKAVFALPSTDLVPGNHVFTASYNGDAYFLGNTTRVSQHLNGDTVTTLTMSDVTPVPGQTIAFTAHVRATVGKVVPTGTVLFHFKSATWEKSIEVELVNGEATAEFTFPDGSSGTMEVIYSGDRNFGSSRAAPLLEPMVFTELVPTTTSLVSDAGVITVKKPVTLTASVVSDNGVPDGSLAFFDGQKSLGTAPLKDGKAKLVTSTLAIGSHQLTAHYAGSADFEPSQSAPLTQVIEQNGSLDLSIAFSQKAFVAEGQDLTVIVTVTAKGAAISGIVVTASGFDVICPQTKLAAGQSMQCTGHYIVTATDMAAGAIMLTASASGTGVAAVVADARIVSGVAEVQRTFGELTDTFITTRQKLIVSSIKTPNIFDRLRPSYGQRAGTVFANGDGTTQTIAFATSLADVLAWGAAQGGDVSLATDPLPFNVWLDANMTLHANTQDGGHWGQFANVTIGADYLVTDRLLLGTLVETDMMSDYSDDTKAKGNGFLAGLYGSYAIDEHLSFDTSLLYGRSFNEATAKLFEDTFKGLFETDRLVANAAVSGHWESGALTLRPSLSFSLVAERARDYFVTNTSSDAVLIQGGMETDWKAGIGSTAEYRLATDGKVVFTPKAGVDIGLSGHVSDEEVTASDVYGSLMLGVGISGGAWTIDTTAKADFDTSGFSALSGKAAMTGNF